MRVKRKDIIKKRKCDNCGDDYPHITPTYLILNPNKPRTLTIRKLCPTCRWIILESCRKNRLNFHLRNKVIRTTI